MLARVANTIWCAANRGRHARFLRALDDPMRAQEDVLRRILTRNVRSEYGRRFEFARLASIHDFQRAVPLTTYDDYDADLARVRRGDQGVLTAERVDRLVPSSGSSAARKLIPYTRALRAEMQRAIGPWVVDLMRRGELRRGRAYWSISPALKEEPSDVPVGFEDDSDYAGPWLKHAVDATLAVPARVRHLEDVEAFRYATLFFLLRARDLALVSVWHPSFLTLLLDEIPRHWEELVDDVRRGVCSLPRAANPRHGALFQREFRPLPRRARELEAAGPDSLASIWPRLALVSCWTDGPARHAVDRVRRLLPEVEIQGKGLVATEAFISLPFAGLHPIAIRSHFFEFVDADGRVRTAGELECGAEYSVVVTTGGGLYRYRLRDRVRVDRHVARTPSLEFVGKEDGIVDLCGEKLSDSFVSGVLERVLRSAHIESSFAMLAPCDSRGPGYVLFIETPLASSLGIARELENELRANPHYAWCADLGQLVPARVFTVSFGAHATYVAHRCAGGRKLGDVKPVSLSAESGWERRFHGRWCDERPHAQTSAADVSR